MIVPQFKKLTSTYSQGVRFGSHLPNQFLKINLMENKEHPEKWNLASVY
jgi:hypothetical protein